MENTDTQITKSFHTKPCISNFRLLIPQLSLWGEKRKKIQYPAAILSRDVRSLWVEGERTDASSKYQSIQLCLK